MADKVKLNLGSGPVPLAGYVNVDRCFDRLDLPEGCYAGMVYPLPGKLSWAESADEIRASHVLEHFPHGQTSQILKHWVSALRPGGVLRIAVPDFEWICRGYLEQRPDSYEGYLMGGQTDEYDFHKAIFDVAGLTKLLEEAGLVDIEPWTSEVQDCASLPVSLNLQGRKPEAEAHLPARREALPAEAHLPAKRGPLPPETGGEGKTTAALPEGVQIVDAATGEPVEVTPEVLEAALAALAAERLKGHPDPRFADYVVHPARVVPIMTAPRLGFTAFMHCAMEAFVKLGINLRISGGAFWNQGLERVMETAIAEGAEYILTCDYDSVFTAADVQTLIGMMEVRPDIDALAPLQMGREVHFPLTSIHEAHHEAHLPASGPLPPETGGQGKAVVTVDRERFLTDVTPIDTAHFGLTVLRASSLADLPKPWFQSVPDPEGGWGDGRVDADIAFWHAFKRAGKKLYQANRVPIGHLQLVVTWPDAGFKPLMQFTSEYFEYGKPAGVWKLPPA